MQAAIALHQLKYRGQGESYRPLTNPEKGYVESYARLGEELAEFAEQVRIADKPLFFYSISKGAAYHYANGGGTESRMSLPMR